jgi:hypothetical protein
MKHIKIYEKFEKTLVIDILSLCNITHNMYDAVELLKHLAEKSSNVSIKRNNQDFGNYFDHYIIPKDNSITNKDEDGLDLKGEAFSYQYIINHPDKNVIFTFYNIEIDEDYLSIISSQNKYNL